jgi:methionyl-tRNA formyltransferase
MAGESETGVTIFQLDEGLDTGAVHSQVATRIEAVENAGDLLSRLTQLSITMLDECLALIESGIASPKAQIGEPTFAPKLSRSDSRVNLAKGPSEIENLIRGCNPEPVAWALLDGEPIRLLQARASQLKVAADLAVGRVFSSEGRIYVATGNAEALELLEVQPASKKAMAASDWHRGLSQEVTLS